MTAPRALAVIQARLGSTRLPGKTLADLGGRPMLAHVVERATAIPGVDGVVIATTTHPRDDRLADWARAAALPCVRGSEDDVLDRFHDVLAQHACDAVVRVTPDCPFLDPEISGRVVAAWREGDAVDYASNVEPPTFPDGLDTEVISRAALLAAWREARLPSDREHVTPFVRRHRERFRQAVVGNDRDLSHLRWTVDIAADLDFARAVVARLAPSGRERFGMPELLALLAREPDLARLNAGQRRNEGYERSLAADAARGARVRRRVFEGGREGGRPMTEPRSYQRSLELLARARRVVPGASQTLSKGPAMFVEGAYPVFLQRGSGCRVWDVDGNEYVDYILGLASITLGYAYPAVTEAVARQLAEGSIFSLPHPLEVEISERLAGLIPCAEMVRFVKTGSEADAAAVRRFAATGAGRDFLRNFFGGMSGAILRRARGIPDMGLRRAVRHNGLTRWSALEEHRGRVAAVIMERAAGRAAPGVPPA